MIQTFIAIWLILTGLLLGAEIIGLLTAEVTIATMIEKLEYLEEIPPSKWKEYLESIGIVLGGYFRAPLYALLFIIGQLALIAHKIGKKE